MEKKFKYEYNSSERILYKYYYGPFTVEEIITSWEYAFENDLIPEEAAGFILDYTEGEIDATPRKHAEIVNFYHRNLEYFRGKRIAIIVLRPEDTVISVLIEKKDREYESRPFSTKEAAKKWIKG